MLRLLALALLLPALAQAQSDTRTRSDVAVSLFPCLSDAEYEELYSVVDDPESFAVWGDLDAFQTKGSAYACPAESRAPQDRDDARAVFYAIADGGGMLLDAVVELDGEPLPFAVVVAMVRDGREEPARVVAVGVAGRDGEVTMALPPTRNALRLVLSGDGDRLDPESLAERVRASSLEDDAVLVAPMASASGELEGSTQKRDKTRARRRLAKQIRR